jgi:hypothetical protein
MRADVDHLLQRGPWAVVEAVGPQSSLTLLDEDIHALAYNCGFTARNQARERNSSMDSAIDWAQASLAAYEALLRRVSSVEQHAVEYSSMMLRAYLIDQLGAAEGHPLLDPIVIEKWFASRAEYSLEEAGRKAQQWQSTDQQSILALRNIKTRLNVIEVLFPKGVFKSGKLLGQWLNLKLRLP